MRVLQVNDNDLFGSRFNGYTLNERLRERGHDAHQVVWTKHSEDPGVHELAAHNAQRVPITVTANQLQNDYAAHAAFSPFSYEIPFRSAFQEADVVNYHLFHNFFANIFHLPMLTRLKPTVWTLHDPWAMTGHCIHPFHCDRWKTGCGRCPLPEVVFAIDKDTTALNWEIKKQTYAQCDLDLVVASKWMLERVKQSPLLQRFDVHFVPFGVDSERFKPADQRAAKAKLGIDPDSLVLAMRVIPGEFKGIDVLKQTLEALNTGRPVTLLTFNYTDMLNEFKDKFRIVELGWVHGDDKMVEAYQATDLFFMPSTAESFGMMAMESMACGVPAVVSEGTALPETIHPEEHAGVVRPHEPAALAAAIKDLLEDDAKRKAMGIRAREVAKRFYSEERYVSDMLRVYETVIDKRRGDERAAFIVDELRRCVIKGTDTPDAPAPQDAPADLADAAGHATTPDAPPPTRPAPPTPVPDAPDSLTFLIKLHAKLFQSRLLRRVWHSVAKPIVARVMRARANR